MEVEVRKTQTQLVEHFTKLVAKQQLVHAYLFSGPAGVGKMQLALYVAQAVFCQQKEAGKPCLKCPECRRIAENNHPDVVRIIPEGLSIKVEQIRYLKTEFSKSGVEGKQKIFIIQDADKMTVGAANSLLKFLEEPSGQVTAFLLTSHLNQILPTIISRCQLVELLSLTVKQLTAKLVEQGLPPDKAQLLAHLTGDLKLAKQLAADDAFNQVIQSVWEWYRLILKNDLQAFVLVQTKLMTYAETRAEQELLLQLLVLIVRDAMLLHYQRDDEVAFSMYKTELSQQILPLSATKLVAAMELVLKSWPEMALNVAFQNILEELTLNLCNCYHQR